MSRRLALACLAVALGACPRTVREERREQPVDTGVPVPFQAREPLAWDFGDGSARATGQQVLHAYDRAGTYVVQGFAGDALAERVEVVVAPRSVFHAVPPQVQAFLAARTVGELSPAVDFAERLVGARTVQRFLDEWPVVAFAIDTGVGDGSALDPAEGLGAFVLAGSESVVSFLGVRDEAKGLEAFEAWLGEHGWRYRGDHDPLRRWVGPEQNADVFVDRGVLYAVVTPRNEQDMEAWSEITRMGDDGLEGDPQLKADLDALPAGGVVALLRPDEGQQEWRLLAAALKVADTEASLAGRLYASGPLWEVPKDAPSRLLGRSPEGPVGAASASMPAARLAQLLLGGSQTRPWQRLARAVGERDGDLEKALAALQAPLDVVAYFDALGFLKSAVVKEGAPDPRGTVLAEVAVNSPAAVEPLLDALVRQWERPAMRLKEGDLRVWRSVVSDQPVEVALTQASAFLRYGEALTGREPEDLAAELSRRFSGAFGPGHLSVLLDVGQLRRELMVPRLIPDADPRRIITAQALALTFLDQLTQVDQVVLDAVPSAHGAEVQAVVTLRKPQGRPPR